MTRPRATPSGASRRHASLPDTPDCIFPSDARSVQVTGWGGAVTDEAEHHVRSVLVGDLRLPPEDAADQVQVDPGEKVPMLVELNLRYPGGLAEVRRAFYAWWEQYAERAGGSWPAEPASVSPVQPPVPAGLALVAPQLYQCVLSRAAPAQMGRAGRSLRR